MIALIFTIIYKLFQLKIKMKQNRNLLWQKYIYDTNIKTFLIPIIIIFFSFKHFFSIIFSIYNFTYLSFFQIFIVFFFSKVQLILYFHTSYYQYSLNTFVKKHSNPYAKQI